MKKQLLIILISSLSLTAQALQYQFEKSSGNVIFKARALGLNFEGKGEGAQGQISIDKEVTGKLVVNLDSFDTGIGLRTTHMKDKYLETTKYPQATLVINKVKDFDPNKASGEYDFEGSLILREVEKPISNGKVTVKKTATGYDVSASFDTKISNYSIPIPKYAGVALKDEIAVVTEAKAILAKK